jgi:hypothetical protein
VRGARAAQRHREPRRVEHCDRSGAAAFGQHAQGVGCAQRFERLLVAVEQLGRTRLTITTPSGASTSAQRGSIRSSR